MTKAPIGFELLLYMIVTGSVGIAGAWRDEPELYMLALLGMSWYIARSLCAGVSLLAEIRDNTNRGQR